MSDSEKAPLLVSPRARKRMDCVLDDDEFIAIPWPEQIPIIAPWLCFGSYHLIYGDAGVGKTYFILSLVMSVLTGEPITPWVPVNKTSVLYIDGEMHASDLSKRLQAMYRGLPPKSGKMYIWSSYVLATKEEDPIDITNVHWQNDIILYLMEHPDIKMVILDNLGCLAPLMDQNDQREWSTLCAWILKLKRLDCAVVLAHHPNKQGGQRGTGARNDAADTVIHLKDNRTGESVDCKVTFDKARGLMGEKRKGFNFCLIVDDPEGTPTIRWETTDFGCTKGKTKKEQIIGLLENGFDQAAIVAKGYSKGQVSGVKAEWEKCKGG